MSTFSVTSRAEALSRYMTAEEAEVEALISGIERALGAFSGDTIQYDLPANCTVKAVARVAEIYRKAGWTVVCIEGDEHDSGSMSFT